MTKGKSQFDKLAGEAGVLGRDAAEAVNKSLSSLAKGCEDMARTSMEILQSAAEKQSQFIKEGLSSKSFNEWVEIQNRAAQASFDDGMAALTRFMEMGVRLMNESTAPINSQMTKSMKKASEAMAA